MKWEGLREEYTWQVSEVAKNAEVLREGGGGGEQEVGQTAGNPSSTALDCILTVLGIH